MSMRVWLVALPRVLPAATSELDLACNLCESLPQRPIRPTYCRLFGVLSELDLCTFQKALQYLYLMRSLPAPALPGAKQLLYPVTVVIESLFSGSIPNFGGWPLRQLRPWHTRCSTNTHQHWTAVGKCRGLPGARRQDLDGFSMI